MEKLPFSEQDYDPSIQALLSTTEEDWGDPVKNREKAIPYGIEPIDQATYGIDSNGELIIFQGPEKERKSTVVANIICNYMTFPKLKDKPTTNIDSLESGMNPEKYRDFIIGIIASRLLIEQGHSPSGQCNACSGGTCRELGITPKFLRYNVRSKKQLAVIDTAKEIIYEWPLLIHGASINRGNTRNLGDAITGTKDIKARWRHLIDTYGMKVLVIDHVQQYMFKDAESDYEKQVRAIGEIGSFIAQHNVACLLISQVSLGSIRESRTTGGKLMAAGGSKAAQEANTVFSVSYKSGSGMVKIKIEEAREASAFPIWIPIEDRSGTFYGKAFIEPPN